MPSPRDSVRRALLWIVTGFGVLAVYFTGVFPPFANPNELSRLQAVVAMAELGTFSIDVPVRTLGNHEDKAESGGRYYSNKAPGLAFAALPVYRALRLLLPAPRAGTGDAIFYWMRLLTVSLVCVIAVARFGSRLAARREEKSVAPIVTLAAVFGTPFLFYARSFFGHAWTAALLFLAWDVLRRGEENERRRGTALFFAAAGLLSGWAVISEYTVGPIALFLGFRAFRGRSGKKILSFGGGAAIPAALLLFYQAVCFGSPWLPSYAKESYPAYAELASRKFFGFEVPSPEVAWNYLLHPARGVLLFSPFLLWSFVGFVRWWRSREDRADCFFALAATVSFFLLLAGYPNWHGGWALGSRYLLPALFFVVLPIPRSLSTPLSRGLFLAAAVYSVANHALLTAAWTHFPLEVPWPAVSGSLWFLSRGWVAPNLGSAVGLNPATALLFPLLVSIALLALVVRALPAPRPRAAVAVLLGVAPLLALLLRPPQPPFPGRLWRASVLGAFSGKDPARKELLRVIAEAATPEEKYRSGWAWRIYGRSP